MPSLAETLSADIARSGPIPFRQFMERALYEPGAGYYASGRAAIGRRGDFLTSVSVGPLFGRLLTVQFEEMWRHLGKPAQFDVVEQGANNGDFAHDVLCAAKEWPEFAAALRYRILEPFPLNAARQQERLAGLANKVIWHASLEALPPFTGVHFSNELVDALPVHRVVFRGGAWRECYVSVGEDENFVWSDGPLSDPALAAFLPHLPMVEGYATEINLAAPEWVAAALSRLERGYVLLADYGFSRTDYYLPERTQGTLSAYRQHRRCDDALVAPGEQDLTAHAEFTTLAERAVQTGASVAGFTDQHHFLAALGMRIFPDVTDPRQLTPERQKALRAFASLMHPTLMGRGFQFLALEKNAPGALCGFELARDARAISRLGL